MALLTNDKEVLDKEYENLATEMYSKGHSFFTYLSNSPDSLASCCRLRNEMEKSEFNFTSGLTGVATGSVNVITLNLNRIIQDFKKISGNQNNFYPDKFKDYLVNIVYRVQKYHIAYKELLYELYDNKMLPVYTAGYIKLEQQFSTIGINGLNEAAAFLGLECTDNEQYNKFCNLITSSISKCNKLAKTSRIKYNLEFVPAEGLGIKNYKWDKEDGYWVPETRNCYNSYFYEPDNIKLSVLDKFKLHGAKYTNTLDGGVGLHMNLDNHLSQEQYKQLFKVAIKEGTSYFTFNIPNSECKSCGHIEKVPLITCPKCGSNKIVQ